MLIRSAIPRPSGLPTPTRRPRAPLRMPFDSHPPGPAHCRTISPQADPSAEAIDFRPPSGVIEYVLRFKLMSRLLILCFSLQVSPSTLLQVSFPWLPRLPHLASPLLSLQASPSASLLALHHLAPCFPNPRLLPPFASTSLALPSPQPSSRSLHLTFLVLPQHSRHAPNDAPPPSAC